ncbi:hypothetical protein GOP47_0007843 [Adiantum capillus-veneris]|uniref:O-fucosyltransferase family protein n=1 Tax=Adiantum capillus-veneris TaxID=13818 RepID=A0A9D4V1U7_ADICA|nr:hypothetical protein GOP47_0007068 [Adiantum capillus-veneris]KAI5078019.1 hypothetical protein GOP47_0007843 [Adiantum capillus-veneris]
MPFDVRQAVAGALTIGMFVALTDMMLNGPGTSPHQDITVSVVTTGDEVVGQFNGKGSVTITVSDKTPKKLWGMPGPILQPCWSKHIASKQKKNRGFVLIKLSNNPLYHPMQVADAVIVARSLGAILILPSGGFSKLYDADNFVSSLNGVVQVVARLPAKWQKVKPEIVKVPYKVTLEYIEEKVKPVFSEKNVVQITSVHSTFSSVKDSSMGEMQAIRCLVTYSALQLHPKVKELGEKAMNSLIEVSGSQQFIAVDLRVDMLHQLGCKQPENSRSKRCFDASDVATFLKRVGFSSNVPIYLTQSTWDQSLDVLKDTFPKVYTKDQLPALTGHQLIGQQSQLEKALDFYLCTHSDVFVPAISGISYVNIAGHRIATGKTQILVPTLNDDDSSSKLQVARVVSRFVTKKDHFVYSCFCKSSSSTSEIEEDSMN